ncbi:hypothetical protein BDZ97DRAFT_1926195 [Flammula alnicola]|nr:hypothetical protein BDZ97DRAFT_1926195 [Flammula alnicola]
MFALQATADSTTLLLAFTTTNEGRLAIQDHLNSLNGHIRSSEATVDQMMTNLAALHSRLLPVVPAASTFVSDIAHAQGDIPPMANVSPQPTISNKRARSSMEDNDTDSENNKGINRAEHAVRIENTRGTNTSKAANALMEIDDHNNPRQIATIEEMIIASQPHAFVISETKTTHHVSSQLGHLRSQGYDFHESPGCPVNSRNAGKWGVIIGFCAGLFSSQLVSLPAHLSGCTVALDLMIPTSTGHCFTHWLIGLYAPWDPGTTDDDNSLFWPSSIDFCNSSPFSWSTIGNVNATLSSVETSAQSYTMTPAHRAYMDFLNHVDGIDLWSIQPQPNLRTQYTHRGFSSAYSGAAHCTPCSIIDCVASSHIGVVSGLIETMRAFIPCTDHRPITSCLVLSAPPHSGTPAIPEEKPPSSYAPHFCYPSDTFTQIIDEAISSEPSPLANITDDLQFEKRYSSLSQIFISAAHTAFILPTSRTPYRTTKPTNPTIRLVLRENQCINCLIAAMNTFLASSMPPIDPLRILPPTSGTIYGTFIACSTRFVFLKSVANSKLGNPKPTPGSDGWEKWFVKRLGDRALEAVLDLLNYIITCSHFPDCVKQTNISTIHKHGPSVFLQNYRGIACNNLLLNLVFGWLNSLLMPYIAKHSVIPECQLTMQPGVQGCDLLSFISQMECWAERENIPLYILQRDQKKGFDMLEPQGFYDALEAYGLPSTISDLDRSS